MEERDKVTGKGRDRRGKREKRGTEEERDGS
jgi:hypothetical protein